MTRVITASFLVVAIYLVLKVAPAWAFWLTIGLGAVIGVFEMSSMLARGGRAPWRWLALLGTLSVAATFMRVEPPLAPVLAAFLVTLFVTMLVSRETPASAVDRMLGTLLPVFYLGLTLGHLGGLLAIENPEARERGEDLIALALFAVYCGDTFAYFGGRAFGKHKLAPAISPGKTIEGAICGLIGSMLGATLAPLWFFQRLPLGHALLIGAILGAAGIFGDLAESLFKRASDVKDSGGLLPGHGGMLDRIDSLLLAAPVLFWYHRLFLADL